MCDHERTTDVFLFHRDAATVSIPHLEFNIQNYVTSEFGTPFCGEYTRMKICMECGQILNWKPVTDADIQAYKDGHEMG